MRREAHVLVADTALGVDDELAVFHELLSHLDRRGEETTGVVAEVEDERLHAVLGELLQGRVDVVGRLLLELPQPDVLDAVAEVVRPHRLHADLLPHDLEVLRLGPALADDADDDLAARPAPHALHGVGELHVLGHEAVDLHDPVGGMEASPMGGRALDGRHDRQHVVAQRDLDAETAEASGGLHLHLAVALRIEEGRVRIEPAQRALDGVVDQVLGRNLVHVLVLDDREHLREKPKLLVGRATIGALASNGAPE